MRPNAVQSTPLTSSPLLNDRDVGGDWRRKRCNKNMPESVSDIEEFWELINQQTFQNPLFADLQCGREQQWHVS